MLFSPSRRSPVRTKRVRTALGTLALCAAITSFAAPGAHAAQAAVGLGTAASYAVLGGSTVTNTGPSVLAGDLGLSPGSSITGFPPGTATGATHVADAAALQAQSDLTIAYDDAAGRTTATTIAGDLGGRTLPAGLYKSATSIGLTGTLTLDAQGDPNAVFIFQVGSTLTTASSSRVALINGAQSCNVFWQIGSSATLGATSTFRGNLLALTSITALNSATIDGRLLARNGAVTLDNDTITAARCATPPAGGGDDGTGGGGGGTGGDGGTGGGTGGTGGGTGGTGGGGTGTGGGGTATRGTATLVPSSIVVTRHLRLYGTDRCLHGTFRAAVRGAFIRNVTFSTGGRVIAVRRTAPFAANVAPSPGMRVVTARITFRDGTAPVTRRLVYRSCARAIVAPRPTALPPIRPPGFTG